MYAFDVDQRRSLSYAFLDIAFVGAVLCTLWIAWAIITRGRINVASLAGAVFLYGVYAIGAVRLGTSPLQYLRHLGRPVQEGLRQDPQDHPPA